MNGSLVERMDGRTNGFTDGWMDGRRGCGIKLLEHLEEKERTCAEELMKG